MPQREKGAMDQPPQHSGPSIWIPRRVSYNHQDPSIQSIEESEKLNLKIVAAEHLRNSFVGIYDIKASDASISQPQRRALERLAIARTNGITQSELAKEFGMKGNNIFYVLRNLECRGLIVRQSTIVKKKEACNEREPKNSSIVATNMLHLYRYAKHLGTQQRLEITKEDKTLENDNAEGSAVSVDGVAEECIKEDVHVKDYLPALKAICDKLEKADGKILSETLVIKELLGIEPGEMLKDARVVEEFYAKVNKREVSCLRLLKEFSPKSFEPKTPGCGYDDLDTEQLAKMGKRGQITEQLVELPIEYQIYDMIDAEGSKGLTITEVCKRLRINNKRYYTRLLNMFSRFGMHLQAESLNRGVAYRVWTSNNFNPDAPNVLLDKTEPVFNDKGVGNSPTGDPEVQEMPTQSIEEVDYSTPKGETRVSGDNVNIEIEAEITHGHGSPLVGDGNNMLLCPRSPETFANELGDIVPDTELQTVNTTTVSDIVPSETSPPSLLTPRRRRSYQRYPCLTLGAASALREQRILEMLQGEKFIIKAELHRHLESLEKEKHTMMDRKTLDRSLNKLQQEGHCKCIRVSVPVVTNCGRSRTMDVVLHPSVNNVSPELLGQIHERLRSFEMQVRGQGFSRLKKSQSIPVLHGVQRISRSVKLDVQSERSEAMRVNGFVFAKMVRTKLLHIFLWGWLCSLPGWDDALSSGEHGDDLKNPHRTCKLFDLDLAIKAMPLELFLQVVGSTQNFDDMIEKCRTGLCLSNLPLQEFKHILDTQATGRLSYLIDILRRLKLIRLVSSGDSEDAVKVQHATLTHALELKPYIEEPVTVVDQSSDFISLDLRPQIRHDFVLSSRNAVHEYWNTLEYCYAAANSRAALHSFPGSAVHEVFLFRSWASVRVMTADQRAELLKCIVNDGPNKKLSFKECEKIAKDLNLTLEQVLRVYYDKRQKRLTRLQGVFNAKGKGFDRQERTHALSSLKRKRSSEGKSLKHVNSDTVDGQSGERRHSKFSDTDGQVAEEQNFFTSSVGNEDNLKRHQVDDHKELEEPGSDEEDEGDHSFIRKCALSRLKPMHQRKFSWTEKADRQLVIEYVRHRAALGANFHRADWASLSNLPAPPDSCKRRMSLLNRDVRFRKTVMRLCNMLSERYANYLDKYQIKKLKHGDCRVMLRDCFTGEDFNKNSECLEQNQEFDSEERWDDFDSKNLKVALDEVLRYKRIAKLDTLEGVRSVSEEQSDLNRIAEIHEPKERTSVSSTAPTFDVQICGGRSKLSGRRSSWRRLPRKYIKVLNEGTGASERAHVSLAVSNAAELFKLIFLSNSTAPEYIKVLNEGTGASEQAHVSLAVSNAAELFKLIFLSNSTAPEVPNLLAETLRRYSEHDLFAAFNYLRDKKIMVGGSGSSPFVLSQHFLQRISSSTFPSNTGKRATQFASWLYEREKDLMEEGIDLTADLQCGDVLHMCALISSGELVITPYLPDDGIGEAEDSRTLKRKSDNLEVHIGDKAKRLKPLLAGEGEITSRREKGFPGIRVSLSRATISRANALEFFKDGNIHFADFRFGENDQVGATSGVNIGTNSSSSDYMEEILDSGNTIPTKLAPSESLWEAMTCYAEHLVSLPSDEERGSPFYPEIFKTVYSAIQKAGDQGLNMVEISQVLSMQGKKVSEVIVEVLEAFGRALKVLLLII
ncbi:unnamed protein product [Ilex paraguariensis]|uniref:B-block binding subunit of TFIIIC domain-containing protein n=1 Tax=Ilex paraguariensis TaxID=185542 RepID=A0ABC8UFV3_9AQUA